VAGDGLRARRREPRQPQAARRWTIRDGINRVFHHDVKFTIRENCFAADARASGWASPPALPCRRPVRVPLRRESPCTNRTRGEVSIGTVSRALKTRRTSTRRRASAVMTISRRLGMRPRGLARRRHFAILVPDREKVVSGGYVDILVQELLYALSR